MGKRKSAGSADGSKSKAPKALPPVETIETGHLTVFRSWLFLGSTGLVAMEICHVSSEDDTKTSWWLDCSGLRAKQLDEQSTIDKVFESKFQSKDSKGFVLNVVVWMLILESRRPCWISWSGWTKHSPRRPLCTDLSGLFAGTGLESKLCYFWFVRITFKVLRHHWQLAKSWGCFAPALALTILSISWFERFVGARSLDGTLNKGFFFQCFKLRQLGPIPKQDS